MAIAYQYRVGDLVTVDYFGVERGRIVEIHDDLNPTRFTIKLLDRNLTIQMFAHSITELIDDEDIYGVDPDQVYLDDTVVECVCINEVSFDYNEYRHNRRIGAVGKVSDFFNKESLNYNDHVYHVVVDGQTTIFWAHELQLFDPKATEPIQLWLGQKSQVVE